MIDVGLNLHGNVCFNPFDMATLIGFRFGARSNQKLSASVDVKEQLRDLRIIVGAEEIHISGVNVIRTLNNVPWTPQETQDFRTIVFHGLDLELVPS